MCVRQRNCNRAYAEYVWVLSFAVRNEPEFRRCIADQALVRFKTPGARADAAASGHQAGTDDPRAGHIPAGMGRLLRLQPVARVAILRRLDSAAPALRRVGPMEDAWQAISGAQATRRVRASGQRGRLQPERPVATELHECPAPRLHQRSLQTSGSASHGLVNAQSAEPPWYGPVCPVVWEGWHREMPPYPD